MLVILGTNRDVAIFHDDGRTFATPHACAVVFVEFYGPFLRHALLHVAVDDLARGVDNQGVFGVLVAYAYDRGVETVKYIGFWVVLSEVFAHREHGLPLPVTLLLASPGMREVILPVKLPLDNRNSNFPHNSRTNLCKNVSFRTVFVLAMVWASS